jgi:hypothetical protein
LQNTAHITALHRVLTFTSSLCLAVQKIIRSATVRNAMGLSAIHTADGSNSRKSSGIIKSHTTSHVKPKFKLRSTSKHFWYTASDGITRLAVNSDASIVPEQINTYDFNPSHFRHEPCPFSPPSDGVWPPQRFEDIACAIGGWDEACVGDMCYSDEVCNDPFCHHTFENWRKATADWEEHVELRMTDCRGIGVFAKSAFREGDVLGWYTGELKTLDNCGDGDYLMEMEIGAFSPHWDTNQDSEFDSDHEEAHGVTVYIDGEKKGNWTRFINHSCKPHALFRIRRVGRVKIMTVEAIRDVSAGEELTVSYGNAYYGTNTRKVCCCGTSNCVGRKKGKRHEGKETADGRKIKVKKCRRVAPP